MKKLATPSLWKHFLLYLEDNNSLSSLTEYYLAIVGWVTTMKNQIGRSNLESSDILPLLELDPTIYVTGSCDLDLSTELNRLTLLSPRRIDTLLSLLVSIISCMVFIKSGIDCPNCVHSEFRYVMDIDMATNNKKILLECDVCNWCQDLSGEISTTKSVLIPASRKDLIQILHK